jgi:hypothetical protein
MPVEGFREAIRLRKDVGIFTIALALTQGGPEGCG